MELEHCFDAYQKEDIAVFAICPEPLDAMAEFVARNGIRYPVLSDAGGELIRRLGIRNEQVPTGDPVEGIPYPGSFLVQGDGVIFEKRFHPDFHVREPMASLLLYFRLREHSDRLEDMVRDRTRKLEAAQSQLIETARIATLGKLVGAINHELNTPVGVLAGGLGVVWSQLDRACQDLTPAQREALKNVRIAITAAGQRIAEVAAGLRALAGIDRSEVLPADLRKSLDAAADLLHSRLEGVALRRDYEEIPPILCREPQIRQALFEVLSNAAEATPRGGSINLGARREAGGVELTIRDTGRGIAPEELPGFFDVRLRVKDGRVGMAIGLPLVHRIVQEHGGSVGVASQPGQGTTISIHLPERLP